MLCPSGIAWLGLRSWQEKEAERARNIARSDAIAERKSYLTDFIHGLTSGRPGIPQPFAVSSSHARRHGEKLAVCFEEQLEETPTGPGFGLWQSALAEYLRKPEARDHAALIGIPVAALPIAAEKLEPKFECGSVYPRVFYRNRK